jgi:hypothetical protein
MDLFVDETTAASCAEYRRRGCEAEEQIGDDTTND